MSISLRPLSSMDTVLTASRAILQARSDQRLMNLVPTHELTTCSNLARSLTSNFTLKLVLLWVMILFGIKIIMELIFTWLGLGEWWSYPRGLACRHGWWQWDACVAQGIARPPQASRRPTQWLKWFHPQPDKFKWHISLNSVLTAAHFALFFLVFKKNLNQI